MPEASIATSNGRIWYHPDRVESPGPGLFDPDAWRERAEVGPASTGRGATWFIDTGSDGLVLRGYRRGGMVGRLIQDWYVYTGEARTRPAREWRVLRYVEARGLPGPGVVAARYVRQGPIYRADILTLRLPGTTPLSAVLAARALPRERWMAIGRCIRRFHDAGVCHADLNAHNILINDKGAVFLIDFDRARLRRPGRWVSANLARLARSLDKLSATDRGLRYGPENWRSLLEGYRNGGD